MNLPTTPVELQSPVTTTNCMRRAAESRHTQALGVPHMIPPPPPPVWLEAAGQAKPEKPQDISTTLTELQCLMSPPITTRRAAGAQAPASSMCRCLSRLLVFLLGRTGSRCQSPSYRWVALSNRNGPAPGAPGGNSSQPLSLVPQTGY